MNRLEHYRNEKGLSQTELANKLGVDQADISRAETGVKDLKGNTWAGIAKILNCTVDELLGVERPF